MVRAAERALVTLGATVRQLRERQSLTMQALSDASGVSVGMLSQIERGIANPSFVTLNKLAAGLGVPLGTFLDAPEARSGRVVRAHERKRLTFAEPGIDYQLLTPDLNGQIEMLLIEVQPGVSTDRCVFSHTGEETGFILSGALEVHLGDTVETLNVGDSITFSSATPHWYRNPGEEKTVCVWTITPPSF